MQQYLPSKQFISRVVILASLLIIAVGVYKTALFFKHKLEPKSPTNLVVTNDIIQKDSNSNGIPDWEESLWGLNPMKDGPSNKEFILAQKKILANEDNLVTSSSEPENDTDATAREFFSVIMSLRESGDLDETAIQSVSNTIGKKIDASPLPDIYTRAMLRTIKANPANTQAYFDALSDVMNIYKDKDIGKELTFISVGMTNNDPGALTEAKGVASQYRALGKELMKIQVTTPQSTTHLALANDYEKVARSIESMAGILTNPIESMKGVISYKKYTDELVTNIETLSKDL